MTTLASQARGLALVALLMLFSAACVLAQDSHSAIVGKVTDPYGSVIPDATVIIVDESTGLKIELNTNSDGIYSAEGLNIGQYTVTISKLGFKTSTIEHIHLDPGERRANSVSLSVGSQSSTVTVYADAQTVNTESSESAGTIDEKQIDNLMLNGRNFQTLGLSVPGVASVGGTDAQTGSRAISLIVNGAGAETSIQTIDGIYNMNSGDMYEIDLKPIVDGIAEFSVLKDNYSAKYGYASSAQILVVTKAGGSQFHGSAWEYIRNNDFDAKNYFSTITPALHQNIFGYTFGGPVIIPRLYNGKKSGKTFFFASNQWLRNVSGVTVFGAVMPEALRNGDFTDSASRAGNLALDAHSTALLTAEGKTNCITTPNVLSPACFDPVAIALLKAYFPLPNSSVNGFANFLNQGASPANESDFQYRLDHHISNGESLIGRVNYMSQPQRWPYAGASTFNNFEDTQEYGGFNGFLRLQSTLKPTLLNTFTMAESRFRLVWDANGGRMPEGVSITQAFPNAPTLNHIPYITISGGYTGIGVPYYPFPATDGEGILQDDVNWVRGRHVLSVGAIYMFGIKHQSVFTIPEGYFNFTGAHTGDPAADFLLGLDSSYSQASTRRHGVFHYRQGEAYVQDDWKATSRLTLNLGVRWQFFSNDTVSGDQVSSFNPSKFASGQAPVVDIDGSFTVDSSNHPLTSSGTIADMLNGIVFAGKNGVPDGFFTPEKTDFGPRVGFAYDLFGNTRSSLRGGYGIGYSRVPLEQIYNAFGDNPPFNETANYLNSLLSNGTAGGTAAAPTTLTLANAPFSFTPTQTQSYSLSIEHQMARNMIATIAYAGSQTRHIMTFQGGYDSNFPLPVNAPSTSGCLAPGQVASSAYDFDPCINLSLASPDHTRPYQGYSEMMDEYQKGSANYNSLQSGVSYRGNPLQFTLAYTYSKALTTVGARFAGGTFAENAALAQNSRNFHAEYGPPSYDFTHDISATWIYNLPKLAQSWKPAEIMLGNWSVAGLFLHQSGYALSPGLATGTQGLASRPNLVAPYRKLGKRTEWFDTSVFAAPGFGFFGNAKNGMIRGPGYTSCNLSLNKAFPITHEAQFRLDAEAFNVFNHPNFETLDTNLGSGTFGQANAAGDPRILEFAMKIVF